MRILIPILAILLGLAVAAAMLMREPAATPQAAEPTQQVEPASVGVSADGENTPADSDAGSPDTATAAPTDVAAQTPDPDPAKPQAVTKPAGTPSFVEVNGLKSLTPNDPAPRAIGSDDPASKFKMKVDLVRWGAGVERITLADYSTEVDQPTRYILESTLSTDPEAGGYAVYPYAARSVTVNGSAFDLQYAAWSANEVTTDDQSSTVTYSITLGDDDGTPLLRIDRHYVLPVESYDLRLHQSLTNLTDAPLEVSWYQNIHGDVIDDGPAYLGDQRLFATGYFNPTDVPARFKVRTLDGFTKRQALVDTYISEQKSAANRSFIPDGIWPNDDLNAGSELVWLAAENRYFTVATHPIVPDTVQAPAQLTPLEETFPRIGTIVFPNYYEGADVETKQRAAVFTLGTDAITVPAGGTQQLDHSIYAGPRERNIFAQFPYNVLNFDGLIRYELGCTWCTFQWLARFLLNFLTFLHDYITHDWGVAIIILVAVVRLLLHPITKKAQVNMMKMGKQMQALQPEMEKLKKKYKDDQQKLNAEMMTLYREKGINPANALGCLPMFLQMPIWVALYAMLYFAIELRHQPAFYGVFQWLGSLFGVEWGFLASLSSPDHFIMLFQEPVTINLILIQLNFQAINILPLLMAVVFFFQQKFMTPPAATEQARQQQKMMKFMVLLFPIFLYSAPSGLTLYILASTAAGVLDSYIVRKHVKEQEESGKLFEKKPRKEGGFMDRISKAMAAKQEEMVKRQQGKMPGGGSGGGKKQRKKR